MIVNILLDSQSVRIMAAISGNWQIHKLKRKSLMWLTKLSKKSLQLSLRKFKKIDNYYCEVTYEDPVSYIQATSSTLTTFHGFP